MMKLNKMVSAGLIALTVMATSDLLWAGSATPESIMVVPARKRMVQLAFEISRGHQIGLITYNNSPSLNAPLLHAWTGHDWIQISMDDYVEGRFMSGDPKHVFLLGDASTLPARMQSGPSWYKDLYRITTLDTAAIINKMGNVLNFSAREWKSLAALFEMKIEDQSIERRRYGRWGAPGKEKDLNPSKLENITLPPAPVIIDEPKVKIEPIKSEMPMPPKAVAPVIETPAVKVPVVQAPVVEAPTVPMTVTVPTEPTAEPVKVEAPAAPIAK